VNDFEDVFFKKEESTYFGYTFRTGVNMSLTSPAMILAN
jgi:hypothetical protein